MPIYTIGYGARSIEQFIKTLKAHDIVYLIDVRSAPYSRYKPEFSKNQLERALRGEGIRYVYMGDLLGGQPDDPDCYIDGKVSYERVREKAFYRQGIGRVQKAFEQGLPVVLMCSEGKPETCHRSKLIGETLTELGVPLRHIDENDALKTQEEVINRLTGGQLSLFGQHAFTSRKRYQKETDGDDA
jgi:uncharacterized protein (DUF488 family)